jgi:hypothetical protein
MNNFLIENFQDLSSAELLSVNGGAAGPGNILSGLIADVTKTATDALSDVIATATDLLSNLGLGSLSGLGGGSGSGIGSGLGGLL